MMNDIDPAERIRRLEDQLAKRVSELEHCLEENARIRRLLREGRAQHMPASPWASPEDAQPVEGE